MTSMFFYGTLRHVPLLAIVLGRSVADISMREAVLPGFSVYAVPGESFPMLKAGGKGAPGLLVEELSDRDVARLVFYEGGYDYGLKCLEVMAEDGPQCAEVFMPPKGL